MKKIIAILILAVIIALPFDSYAKGGGGGRGGGGSRSSSSFRSSTRTTTSPTVKPSTPRPITPPKAVTPKISTKPSASTAKVTTATAKTVNGKTYSKTGSVVGGTYQPKFTGGYTPPVGSTVYYRESSMLDWLPFYLILSSQNAHRSAVIVEPAKDGQPAKETIVKEEGLDTMYVVNWIITILLVLGLIALIVWYVNKRTTYA